MVTSTPTFSEDELREATKRMSQMDPSQLRQQAAAMKAIGPAALRERNPQMAHMTEEQIQIAIAQMEAVANDPNMMRMAMDQVKNMKESELREALRQNGMSVSSSSSSLSTIPKSQTVTDGPSSTCTDNLNKTSGIQSMTLNQFREESIKMSSLTPERLRSQVGMLKSMHFDTLRKTNPHMANMTDDQIKFSIEQIERMAEDPSMIKLAAAQMKNMDEKQFENMKDMFHNEKSSSGGSSVVSSTGSSAVLSADSKGDTELAQFSMDPSKMMESFLTDPEQLSSMIKTMKQNPNLLKSIMRNQLNENCSSNNASSEENFEQIEKAIDQFTSLSDEQLEKYLSYANSALRLFRPVLSFFLKIKKISGLSVKNILILLNMLFFCMVALLLLWKQATRGDDKMVSDKGLETVSDLDREDTFEVFGDTGSEF